MFIYMLNFVEKEKDVEEVSKSVVRMMVTATRQHVIREIIGEKLLHSSVNFPKRCIKAVTRQLKSSRIYILLLLKAQTYSRWNL